MTHTSMLHVRVNSELKTHATETLARFGMTVSDAVRILLTRISKEGGLPAGLTTDPEIYDQWFRERVKQALGDMNNTVTHEKLMNDVQSLINRKRQGG